MNNQLTAEKNRSEDLEKRKQAGKEKKLWGIEVMYRHYESPGSVRRHTMKNYFGEELMNFRNTVFTAGIMMPVDPGHWVIIMPADILQIDVYRQNSFFE